MRKNTGGESGLVEGEHKFRYLQEIQGEMSRRQDMRSATGEIRPGESLIPTPLFLLPKYSSNALSVNIT